MSHFLTGSNVLFKTDSFRNKANGELNHGHKNVFFRNGFLYKKRILKSSMYPVPLIKLFIFSIVVEPLLKINSFTIMLIKWENLHSWS